MSRFNPFFYSWINVYLCYSIYSYYKYYSTIRNSKNYIKLCDNFLMLKIEIYAILSKNTNLDLKVIVENLYFKDI